MQINRMLIKNLAQTADLVNTLNGGMAQSVVQIERHKEEWVVKAKVPGVSVENLKLEVRDGGLFIFQNMTVTANGSYEVPYLLTMVQLNNRIDFDSIVAEYNHGYLIITLPLDEQSSGYEREIQIIKR